MQRFKSGSTISPFSFQIKVITERTDTSSMFERLNQKTQMESDEKVLAAKKDYTTLVKSIASKEASGKRFFLIIEYEGDLMIIINHPLKRARLSLT